MAVMFAAVDENGLQYIDGFHNVQVSNAASDEFLSNLGYPTTVPGETDGRVMYAAYEAFALTPAFDAFSQAKKDLYDQARKAIGTGARICTGLISWR